MLFSIIALEKFAQKSENKATIKVILSKHLLYTYLHKHNIHTILETNAQSNVLSINGIHIHNVYHFAISAEKIGNVPGESIDKT